MISSNRRQMAMHVLLLIGLCLVAPIAFSQTTDEESSSRDSTTNSCDSMLTAGPAGTDPCLLAKNDQPADPNAPTPKPVNAIYTPSLNGGPPILLQQPKHLRFLYGAATTQGYDSNAAGPFSNIDSYTSTYEGYLAATWRLNREYVVLQQDSAYTHFGSPRLKGHAFHQTALLATGELNPNISWIFEAHSFEGNNTLTQLAPLPQVVVNGVPLTTPGAATTGLDQGFVWGTDLVSTINWQPTQHNILSFRAENANHQFLDLGLRDNLSTFELQYRRELSQQTYTGVYALTRHQTGTALCDNVGFGLLVSTRPTARWLLQASGGPEFDSTGCRRHQGFELHGSAVYELARASWTYALVNREHSSGFLPGATSEDSVVAGYSQQLRHRLTWSLAGGYVRGFTGGFLLPRAISPYHGFFSQTQFLQRLSKSLAVEATYRRFDQSVSRQPTHRNIVLFTLRWSPGNHDAARAGVYPYPGPVAPDSRSSREE